MPYTQDGRYLAVDTAAGPDALLLTGFSGTEELSRPFRFTLELASEDSSIDASRLLGKPARVTIGLPSGGERLIHGVVSRFRHVDALGARAAYQAELVPWLWMLSLSTDCRIFQRQSVPEIVAQVFDELGYRDYRLRLVKHYPAREYCVQYRESYLDFVSRLLEDEGILYYFEHEADKHVLVLADTPGTLRPTPALPRLSAARTHDGGWRDDVYTTLTVERAVRTRAVALADYNYLAPSALLQASMAAKSGVGEAFDYPGGYGKLPDGERYARLRLGETDAGRTTAAGTSAAPALTPGYKLEVAGGAATGRDGEWLVLGVRHSARPGSYLADESPGFEYENSFTLAPADVPWRPPRVTPRPRVHGTQSALVVGMQGEEISTDEQGRVKLHFYWDRRSQRDEKSSCWVRCSMAWAGKGWGQFSVPRIGQEVLVDFLEGDPDRPVVMGRVYNGDQPPPCDPGPTGGSVSGIKSKTHRGSGYNEMTMDDTAGQELIRIHGQYDMDTTIEHDERVTIGNDRTESVGNNETISIGANRTEMVGSNETISIGADRTETVGRNETISIGGSRTETVGADESVAIGSSQSLSVGSNQKVDVGGNQNLSVSGNRNASISGSEMVTVTKTRTQSVGINDMVNVGAAQEVSVGGLRLVTVGISQFVNVGMKHSLQAGNEVSVSSKKVVVSADEELILTCAGGTIAIDSSGVITITGTLVKINS